MLAGAIVDDQIINAAIYNFNFEAFKLLFNDGHLIDAAFYAIGNHNRYLLKYLIWKGLDVDTLIDRLIGDGDYSFDDHVQHAFKKDDFYIVKSLAMWAHKDNIDKLMAYLSSDEPKFFVWLRYCIGE